MKLVLILLIVTIFHVNFPFKKSVSKSKNTEILQRYKDRQSHLQNVCEKYKDRLEKDYKILHSKLSYYSMISKVDLLMSNTKNPFLWCKVPKASSASWNNLFMSIWYGKGWSNEDVSYLLTYNNKSWHFTNIQSRTKNLAGFVWRPLGALKIDLKIRVGWVLKNSGNSLFDWHWNCTIWTNGSWDNWV